MHIHTTVKDENEAEKLFLHHLQLAISFFEAAPLNVRAPESHAKKAIQVFIDELEKVYENYTPV